MFSPPGVAVRCLRTCGRRSPVPTGSLRQQQKFRAPESLPRSSHSGRPLFGLPIHCALRQSPQNSTPAFAGLRYRSLELRPAIGKNEYEKAYTALLRSCYGTRRPPKQLMAPTVLCPRHGQTASVLACEHVSAAVNGGSEPPAFRLLRVTMDDSETVAYCACFDCVNRFDLASDFSAPPDAAADASEFPKINPICVKCLKTTQSSRSDADTIPAASRVHTPVRPTQVSVAVLLLCVSLGIDAVTSALSWTHRAPSVHTLSSGIFWFAVNAWLAFNIWMGLDRARSIYAALFGLGIVLYFLIPGTKIDIPRSLIDLVALCLLYVGPGRGWFAAKSPIR
jgi:hypothetical protein